MENCVPDMDIVKQEEGQHENSTSRVKFLEEGYRYQTHFKREPEEVQEVHSVKEDAELKSEDAVLKEQKIVPEENIVIHDTFYCENEHESTQDNHLGNEDIKQETIELGEYTISYIEHDSSQSVGENPNPESSEERTNVESACSSQVEPLADKSKKSYSRKKCEDCGKTFGYQYCLALHRVKEHGSSEKPIKSRYTSKPIQPKFHCDHCDKSYHYHTHLTAHKVKVHGIEDCSTSNESCSLSHSCRHCKIQCSSWQSLVHHLNTVHGESIDKTQFVQCPSCCKKFTTDEEVAEHICLKGVVRITERPFKCDLCDKAYCSRSKLEKHYSVHPEYRNIQCDQCPKGFFNERELNCHKKDMHKTKDSYIECETCNKLFKSQQNWKRHQELHSDKGAYCCEHCGKSFKLLSNLKSHVYKIHRDNQMISCTICGNTLKGKIGLELHMRIHNNDRRYKCPFPRCEKSFISSSCLKKHEQAHTKDYKYKCKFCNYGSISKKQVVSHEEQKHNHKRLAVENDS